MVNVIVNHLEYIIYWNNYLPIGVITLRFCKILDSTFLFISGLHTFLFGLHNLVGLCGWQLRLLTHVETHEYLMPLHWLINGGGCHCRWRKQCVGI